MSKCTRRTMYERLEQLLQLHNMCNLELKLLQTNMENYMQSSAKMVKMMQNSWREVERGNGLSLMIYDNFLTSITNVMNFSRKLNMHLQLSCSTDYNMGEENLFEPFRKKAENQECGSQPAQESNKQMLQKSLENTVPDSNTLMDQNTQQQFFPAEEMCNRLNETRNYFIFPKLKVSDHYKAGDNMDAYVTYIKDFDKLQFYVMDSQSKNVLNISQFSQSLDLHQYHTLPPANEVFGLVIDKAIYRAVRSTKVLYDQEQDEELWPCYLLDFGEVVNLKLSDIKYKLTETQKATPSFALLCQIKASESHSSDAMQKTLKQIEYTKCRLEIKDIYEDILIVELAMAKGAKNDDNDGLKQRFETMSPISASTEKQIITLNNESIHKTKSSEPKKGTNPFLQETSEDLDNSQKSISVADEKCTKLTAEELDMLNDEPLNTSNAMKAVLGYDPQDDKRICRFYDPSTGACFKGANCKQEHIPLHPEGWTKDVIPAASIVDIRSPQIIYPKGTLLNITPTHIGKLGVFYAQINDAHHNNNPFIWNDEDIKPWKKFQTPPHVFELVLSRYEDGLWYRAKVLTHDDDYKMFKVFYVDYGNQQIVDIKKLAKCDKGTEQVPFQAVFCRLAHLKEIDITEEKRNAGIKMLCDTLLNKPLDVKVVSHHEDLIVQLERELNLSLKSKLVHGGYMKPF